MRRSRPLASQHMRWYGTLAGNDNHPNEGKEVILMFDEEFVASLPPDTLRDCEVKFTK